MCRSWRPAQGALPTQGLAHAAQPQISTQQFPLAKTPRGFLQREKVATGKLPTKWPEELGLFAFISKLQQNTNGCMGSPPEQLLQACSKHL